jgi:hypothetical protein
VGSVHVLPFSATVAPFTSYQANVSLPPHPTSLAGVQVLNHTTEATTLTSLFSQGSAQVLAKGAAGVQPLLSDFPVIGRAAMPDGVRVAPCSPIDPFAKYLGIQIDNLCCLVATVIVQATVNAE